MIRAWYVCLLTLFAALAAANAADLPALRVEGDQVMAAGKPVRLRGIDWGWWHLSGTQYTEANMQQQAEWGANIARLAFSYTDLESDDHPGVYKTDGFRQLDEVVQWGKRHGQYVILDMHVAPGGQDTALYVVGGQNRIWADAVAQERFIAMWQEIARRYRDRPEVAAYELMNEPETQQPNLAVLTNLYKRTIAAVRAIDPNKIIVIAGDHWSPARSLVNDLKVSDPNVLYTFHFYEGYGEAKWSRNLKDGPGLSGTRDWVRVEERFTVPADVPELNVMLRSTANAGSAMLAGLVVSR